jgi:hypothetical protein
MKYYALINHDGTVGGMHWAEKEITGNPFPPEMGIASLVPIPSEDDYPAGKVYKNGVFVDNQEQLSGEQKTARVMFRALAQTDVISATDALDNAGMFPAWAERVGTETKIGEYLRHDDGLYRVKQTHKIQEHYPPSTATAALYGKVTMPGEIPGWTTGSWEKGIKVKHNGKIWLSMVDNNTWEPGAAGVYQDIWKEVF